MTRRDGANAPMHTPGPWEYVPSNENHGPYVTNGWGAGDICDCYVMSNPSALAVCNGGTSKPIHMQHDEADANARLIAAAPDLLAALEDSALAIAYLMRQLKIVDSGWTTVDGRLLSLSSIETANATAIAKAKGGVA